MKDRVGSSIQFNVEFVDEIEKQIMVKEFLINNLKRKRNKMNRNIAVVGLGYVGLPVAVTFGKNIK